MVIFTSEARRGKCDVTNEVRVNQYRLRQVVGSGSWCKVKWVVDEAGGGFAAKIFSKAALQRERVAHFTPDGATTISLAERIAQELEILQNLTHSNIVGLHEIIDDPRHEHLYAIFEGMRGGQLMTWEEDAAAYRVGLPSPTAVAEHWGETVVWALSTRLDDDEGLVYQEELAQHVLGQLLEATVYMHEHGVIHKDLKPDNVLLNTPVPPGDPRFVRRIFRGDWPTVSGDGSMDDGVSVADTPLLDLLSHVDFTVKIADFNSAVVSPQPNCPIYDAQGTQLFTPPECFMGDHGEEGVPGKPRDAWSLGCMLFVMLFGRCPFWASESPFALQCKILCDPLVVPEGVLTEPAADLLRLLMAKEVDQRMLPTAALRHPWLGGGS